MNPTKTTQEQKLMLQMPDGSELDLKELLKESTVECLKETGVLDESGKASFKSLPVEVKDEVSRKREGIDNAANFIKAMILPEKQHERYGVKAISTGGGSFGNTVPTELADEILMKKKKFTVLRDNCFSFELEGKFDLPTEGTGVTGYWVAENAAITESNPTVGKASLDDHYLAALVKASWKLLNTSNQNIVNFLATLAGKALAETEETAFIGGDGDGKPTGLRQASIDSVAQAGAEFAYGDLTALTFALPAKYRKNAKYLTSAMGVQLVHELKDSQGRPIFQPGMPLDKVFEKDLLESEDIPSNLGDGSDETEIYLGDLFYYWIKDGHAMEMATQDVVENLQTKIVLYQAVDGKVVLPEAFRKLTGVKRSSES